MSLHHSPRIVTDGLILNLDAANVKSYPSTLNVEVLVVAGGGAGGQDVAGGGGGGGVIYQQSHVVSSGNTTVTVGAGGPNSHGGAAPNGSNSVFGTLTAIGGGGGGGSATGNAGNGGSGGGAGYDKIVGTGTAGQGYNGGYAYSPGGGGGGAGGVGLANGNGGVGRCCSISGTPTYYAGGGAGCKSGAGGIGGLGGGGTWTGTYDTDNGLPNTGGGGAGYYGSWGGAGSGGSGIVIVRYPGGPKATGGTVATVANGYTTHTFTSSGTFTVGTLIADTSGYENHHTITGAPTFNASPKSFTMNGSTQGFSRAAALAGVTTTCTVVMFYKTSDEMELWCIGQSTSYYLSAAYTGSGYYHGLCGSPTNYVDLVQCYNPITEGYRNNAYHMWEAKNVNWSGWSNFGWCLYPDNWHMSGDVGLILVYNRALSAAESAQNYKALKKRFGI